MGASESEQRVRRMAVLVAAACVLQISESLIPHPIPGLRLGLANMLSLTALVMLGFGAALEIAVLRVVLSSFVIGTFMSPTFFLSLSGAVSSTLAMGLFLWLSRFSRHCRLSILGISIVGALTHNVVQLCLAYLMIVRHAGIFALLPLLAVGAILTGWITGVVARGVCRRLAEPQELGSAVAPGLADGAMPTAMCYVPRTSVLHRARPELKIGVIAVVSCALFLLGSLWTCLAVFGLLIVGAAVSRTPLVFLVSRVRRFASFLAIAFVLSLFLKAGTHVVLTLGSVEVTAEGLTAGGLFAGRLLLIIVASALLVRTSSYDDLAAGVARLLRPLRVVGVSDARVAATLCQALGAIPVVRQAAKQAIADADLRKPRNLRRLLPGLSDLVARLYMTAGHEGTALDETVAEPARRAGVGDLSAATDGGGAYLPERR
jgi:heptaprenyl diphosphate synthase